MAWLLSEWSSPRPEIDRHCLALASYNAGLGNILAAQKRAGGKLIYREIIYHLPQITHHFAAETISYVQRIYTIYFNIVARPSEYA